MLDLGSWMISDVYLRDEEEKNVGLPALNGSYLCGP